MAQIPPATQAMRYGNTAYRTWCALCRDACVVTHSSADSRLHARRHARLVEQAPALMQRGASPRGALLAA